MPEDTYFYFQKDSKYTLPHVYLLAPTQGMPNWHCTQAVRQHFATLAALIFSYPEEPTIMLNAKLFEEMSAKLNDLVANSPAKDFEKNARALLAQGFAKLDLVSREEYEVLAMRLDKLEARLAELEKK